MAARTGAVAFTALALCAACGSPPANAVTRCQQTSVVPSRTDILFVVDDSGSMQAEQDKLKASFGNFIDRLSRSPAKNDFQIGVTTTSVDWPIYDAGSSGSFTLWTHDPGSASAPAYPAGALVAAAGHPRILGAGSASLVTDFQANVAVGTAGSSKEQGFRAALLALTDRIADGKNAGFLRPGARLAVVIVSDEDDCSDPASPPRIVYPRNTSGQVLDACHSAAEQALLTPVPQVIQQLRGPLAGEERDVVVAVIAAVDAQKQPVFPSCNDVNGGYPGYRYKAFVDGFGGSGLIDNVCLADFSATLESIANLIAQQITLSEAPADPRLLTVAVAHPDGTRTACQVASTDGDTSGAGAIYAAPQGATPPTLTFQGACALAQGDRVELQVLCAN